MKCYLKYDINKIFSKIIEEQLGKLNVPYKINGLGEIEFETPVDMETMKQVATLLSIYGIEIINDHKTQLVQRVKEAITAGVNQPEILKGVNMSDYLANKLNYSYAYLSSVFSENTYSSIENFMILKKIDRAKSLLRAKSLTLTEIAHELEYSSVAHLSRQFKKITGLTPSVFQKILEQRSY